MTDPELVDFVTDVQAAKLHIDVNDQGKRVVIESRFVITNVIRMGNDPTGYPAYDIKIQGFHRIVECDPALRAKPAPPPAGMHR